MSPTAPTAVGVLDPGQAPGSSTTVLIDGSGRDQTRVERTVLPCGLRVISENMPGARSVSIGVWVQVGSRDEPEALAGSSHFLEHLLFKGTSRRRAVDISAELDAVGGDLNAFTTKELTCYHAHVMGRDLPLAVDVIMDMVLDSQIRAAELESERTVVLEEILMHEDDPGEVVHERFAEHLWRGHDLGLPVIGTAESVEQLSREAVYGWYSDNYHPEQIAVSAAGDVDHERLVQLVSTAVAWAKPESLTGRPLPARAAHGVPAGALEAAAARPLLPVTARGLVVPRHTEQAHAVMGAPGLSLRDPRRWSLGVLIGVLGGGMSSRLFQEVRERRGLAYSVYTFRHAYSDDGILGVYVGCALDRLQPALEVIRQEVAKVERHGLLADELVRGKGHMCGNLILRMEDPESRMSRLGQAEVATGQVLSLDEVVRRIEAVTADDVLSVAHDLFRTPPHLTIVADTEDTDFATRLLS